MQRTPPIDFKDILIEFSLSTNMESLEEKVGNYLKQKGSGFNFTQLGQLLFAIARVFKYKKFHSDLSIGFIESLVKEAGSLLESEKPEIAAICKVLLCISKLCDKDESAEITKFSKLVLSEISKKIGFISSSQALIFLNAFAKLGYDADDILGRSSLDKLCKKVTSDITNISSEQLSFAILNMMKLKLYDQAKTLGIEISSRYASDDISSLESISEASIFALANADNKYQLLFESGDIVATEPMISEEVMHKIVLRSKDYIPGKDFGRSPIVSRGQSITARTLESLGYAVETEAPRYSKGGVVITADILAAKDDKVYLIEYDGPTHFNRLLKPNVATKQRDDFYNRFVKLVEKKNPTSGKKLLYFTICYRDFPKTYGIKSSKKYLESLIKRADKLFEDELTLAIQKDAITPEATHVAAEIPKSEDERKKSFEIENTVVTLCCDKDKVLLRNICSSLLSNLEHKELLNIVVGKAIAENKIIFFKSLIEGGLSLDYKLDEVSILQIAITNRKAKIAIMLIAGGADITSISDEDLNSLISVEGDTISGDDLDLISCLIDNHKKVSLLEDLEKRVEIIALGIKTGHNIALKLLQKYDDYDIRNIERFLSSFPESKISEDEDFIAELLIDRNSKLKDALPVVRVETGSISVASDTGLKIKNLKRLRDLTKDLAINPSKRNIELVKEVLDKIDYNNLRSAEKESLNQCFRYVLFSNEYTLIGIFIDKIPKEKRLEFYGMDYGVIIQAAILNDSDGKAMKMISESMDDSRDRRSKEIDWIRHKKKDLNILEIFIIRNQIDVVKNILRGLDQHQKDVLLKSAFSTFVAESLSGEDYGEMTKFILDNVSNKSDLIFQVNKEGRNPLMNAFRLARSSIIKEILESGAINEDQLISTLKNDRCRKLNLFEYLVALNQNDIIEMVLDFISSESKRVDLMTSTTSGISRYDSALLTACEQDKTKQYKMVELFLGFVSPENQERVISFYANRNDKKESILSYAALSNNVDLAKLILNAISSEDVRIKIINSPERSNTSAIFLAAATKHKDVAKVMIESISAENRMSIIVGDKSTALNVFLSLFEPEKSDVKEELVTEKKDMFNTFLQPLSKEQRSDLLNSYKLLSSAFAQNDLGLALLIFSYGGLLNSLILFTSDETYKDKPKQKIASTADEIRDPVYMSKFTSDETYKDKPKQKIASTADEIRDPVYMSKATIKSKLHQGNLSQAFPLFIIVASVKDKDFFEENRGQILSFIERKGEKLCGFLMDFFKEKGYTENSILQFDSRLELGADTEEDRKLLEEVSDAFLGIITLELPDLLARDPSTITEVRGEAAASALLEDRGEATPYR